MSVLDVDEVVKVPARDGGDEWALRCGCKLYFVPRRLEDELRYVECGRPYQIHYIGKDRKVVVGFSRYYYSWEKEQ